MEPGVDNLHVLRVVSGDQGVHCGDVASCFDCDGLSGFDGDQRQRSGLRADLVHGDGSNQVDEPGVVSKAVDILLCAVDAEFAVVFGEGSAP